MNILAPHQLRVVVEKDGLNERLVALNKFLRSGVFVALPSDEKERLVRQSLAMLEYDKVLGERIEAFFSNQIQPPPKEGKP